MDLDLFANPWEHVRLLSDPSRNLALLRLLERRAPGARVLEIGCGTGLLSVAAAKLGAKRVFAVEPTPLVEVARQLVRDNGLQDRVAVLEGRIEDLGKHKVDLVFSELLNADPFVEGVVEASAAGAEWLAPGGFLAPSRLRVFAALVRESTSAAEVRTARAEVQAFAARLGLRADALLELLANPGPYPYVAGAPEPISAPVLVWDVDLRDGDLADEVELPLFPTEAGPVGGVVLWFEADLDEGLLLSNPPGAGGHWGQLLCAWDHEVGGVPGRPIQVRFLLDENNQVTGEPA